MLVFWLCATVVVGSSAAYHFTQKSISSAANPMVSLIVTFSTAGVASLVLLPLFLGQATVKQEVAKLNWASVVLGLTIVGVDVGYLLLYRSGWNLSLASVFCGAMVALVLLPLGVLVFRERLSVSNRLGIVLALAGVYLITRRP